MNSNKDDFSKINTIIAEIEKNPQSFPFLEPVDHVGLGLTDYLTIIAHPMDLSSVKAKLKGGNYNTYQDALNDIQLIWDNCKKYNLEGSDIYKVAINMEKFTRRLIDKHFKKSEKAESEKKPKVKKEKKAKVEEHLQIKPESIPELELKEDKEEEDLQEKTNPNGISFLEKTTFAERVKKLQNDGLASVRLVIDSLKLVRLVQKECPTSINDSDERIEIILDQLDKKTYEQLNRLIDTFLKVKETNQENLESKKMKA